MRSDRHRGRFFSARIRSQSKPYQKRSPMRSDHHPDYGQIFVAKRQIQSRHCGQMGIFNISL